MIDTIIFDLDGTLLNTLEDLKDSTNYALKKFGYAERTLEEVRNFVGNGVQKLIERAIPDGIYNPDFENCLNVFKKNYAENMYNKTAPYDGIIELLQNLKTLDYKTAVVSNKFDMAVKQLCKTYFGDLISIAIGEDENVRKKPFPDSVFKAIELLGSSNKTSIYCGDSDVDVKTAKNADIECIGVAWGFRSLEILEESGAEFIVNKPSEILKLLNHRQ